MPFLRSIITHYKDKLSYVVQNNGNDVYVMEQLLGVADFNFEDDKGITALIHASHSKNVSLTKFLIKEGADVNHVNKNGETVLLYTCSNKNASLEIIKLLLSAGADINFEGKDGKTCLQKACETSNTKLIKLLTDYGDGVEYVDIDEHLALAASNININNVVEVVDTSTESSTSVNDEDEESNALLRLCKSDNHDGGALVKLLMEGADINCKDKIDNTPLIISSKKGKSNFVNILMDWGADVSCRNIHGETMFTIICALDHSNEAKLVMEMEVMNKYNYPSDTLGTYNNDDTKSTKSTKSTVCKNLDINMCNKRGYTRLMIACMKGDLDKVKSLIDSGADINYVNVYNDTALTYACSNGFDIIVGRLISRGLCVDTRVNYNRMFMLAYCQGYIRIIKMLVSSGHDYVRLCKYHDNDTIYVKDYITSKPVGDKPRYNIIEGNVFSEYKDEIIKIVKKHKESNENIKMSRTYCQPFASDIFSQIVCISDGYYRIKEDE